MADRDPYTVLGVAPDADVEEIALAHRTLARRYHPDVSTDPGAQDHMAAINGAWAILRDPVKRAQWDLAHHPQGHGAGHVRAAGRGGSAGQPAGSRQGATPPTTGTWHRGPDGEGAAGPPPGPRMGTVLPFGRHIGWSIGEIARADPGYLAWLKERREGAPYKAEIERLLATMYPKDPRGTPAAPRRTRWR